MPSDRLDVLERGMRQTDWRARTRRAGLSCLIVVAVATVKHLCDADAGVECNSHIAYNNHTERL